MKQRLLFSFFVIGLALALVVPARAQQQASYDGLDIIFLVDQSGSMGRNQGGVAPNDQLGLRFYSLPYVTSLMGDFHLLINDKATFRMSVVNFGSTAEPWNFADSPGTQPTYWQTIAPLSQDAWKPQYDQLKQSFDRMEIEFSKRDLGNTNFQAVFTAAHDLFGQAPDLGGHRLRVVILLTDGQPYLETPGFSVSQHMGDLSTYAKRYFPEPDYRIYTIGMIDATDPYWQTMQPYWETITGDPCTDRACPDPEKDRAKLVASNTEVGKRFQEILHELTNELSIPADVKVIDQKVIPGPLVVPPYVKFISFAYFKTDPSQQLLLTDPNGKVDPSQPGVEVEGISGPIQVTRISNPLPGPWQIATAPSGIDVDITMRYIFAQSKLNSPSGTQAQFVPLTVKYALLDDLGQPLPTYTDPNYRLVVKAEVSAGGQSWNLTLNSNPDGSYSAEFTPVLAENHVIKVTATSQDVDNNTIIVFDGEIGSFNVSPVLLVPKDLPLSWLQYSEQPITFELQDTRGLPVEAPSSLEMVVTISGETGLPLTLNRQTDGTYQALYTPNQTGPHTVHALASVLDSSGTKQTILDKDIGEFDVSPTTRVDLDVQKPDQPEQLDTGLWFFQRNPLVLQIRFEDENGQPLDPQNIFTGDAGSGLSVVQIRDSKGNPLNLHLNFQQTPETGVYLAESTDFGVGDYVITVAGAALKPNYVYKDKQTDISIMRVPHPLQIPLAIAGLFLLAVVVSGSSWVFIHNNQLSKHPCKGMIYIVDAYGTPKFQKRLDPYGKNRVVIPGKEIPAITHVRKMEFWCESDTQSEAGRIYARVWLDNDRTPVAAIDGKMMAPASEVKIGKYAFWLLKDPEEISDHPEAQDQETFN